MTSVLTEISIDRRNLECAICMEMFDHETRTLACQHSFHLQCLEKIQGNGHEPHVLLVCPLCRGRFCYLDCKNIPKNHLLIDIVDQVQYKESVSAENLKKKSNKLKSAASTRNKIREETPDEEIQEWTQRFSERLRQKKPIYYGKY